MSKRRFYFHVILLLAAITTGGLSLWHDGFWIEGRNKVPNFTILALIFLVIGQIAGIKAFHSHKKKK